VIFNTKLRFPNIFKGDNWRDLWGTTSRTNHLRQRYALA
jgi:hypothetical protein